MKLLSIWSELGDGIKHNRIRALVGQNIETIRGTASNGEGIRNVETGEIDNY